MTGWTARHEASIMDTFGPPQRVLARGEGCYVWDDEGRKYLDLLAGIAVNALGHAHPAWVAAVSEQAERLAHVSNFFATHPQVELAERLLGVARAPKGSRVFLTNSGTEALEAAFKMARRNRPGRILALEGGFHGRTMGALALTHKQAYREPFEPLPPGVEHLPFGDIEALVAAFSAGAVSERGPVAALVLEPIQGEAGVRELPEGYLAAARAVTASHGALLILDEVQTGMGRTGHWLAYHGADGTDGEIVPDVVTLAKGLGGGFPIGAAIAYGPAAATLLGRGQHGSTFGGNALAAAAANATIDVIEREGLLANAIHVGAILKEALQDETLRGESPKAATPQDEAPSTSQGRLVTHVRGVGLLLAAQLSEPIAPTIASEALEAGYIVNAVTPDAIRLTPPLILNADQARQAGQFLAGLGANR